LSSEANFFEQKVLQDFYQSLYKYLREKGGEDIRKNIPPNKVLASELIYDCLRRPYYSRVYGDSIDLQSAMRMVVGAKWHEIPIYSGEMQVEWEDIVGHPDEYDKEGGILLEKKSCRDLPRSPYDHHVKQVEIYRLLLEKNGFPVLASIILYFNVGSRDGGPDAKAFIISPCDLDQLEVELLKKKEILLKSLEERKPPPPYISWLCGYCQFTSKCFSGEE
jgi:CRISPR/Cas system-associated exonuclease Cas4 (RecB family)